jgi:hypothetical protein
MPTTYIANEEHFKEVLKPYKGVVKTITSCTGNTWLRDALSGFSHNIN